jgi:large subunit ribosomal protein L9
MPHAVTRGQPRFSENHWEGNMAKIDVILTQNVVGLGAESDQVKVAAGYARNFLFPQKLAIPLTAANKRRLEVLKQRRGEREAHELNTMTDLAKTISKVTLQMTVKTGEDNKMFGSITAGTIADELKHQFDVILDKRKIHLDKPIRSTGDHEVVLKLHPEITATLKVHVESSTPKPVVPEAAAPEAKEGVKDKPDARRGMRRDRPERPGKAERESPGKAE